ncbi:MlaE family ABC transporter permease [Holophaga foetida]|uniref:MlaE family ABC transporter permease n=1 Tax=Holophaga foetida TaxID=35839 RepID=UPI0002474250|nr:ABC transporter permease [Holophaga foetida]
MSSLEVSLDGAFWRFSARLGVGVRRSLGRLGAISWILYQCFWHGLRLRWHQLGVVLEVTRTQIRFTALDALSLTCFTAFLMGGITLLQVFGQLSAFGAETYLSRLLAKLVIRELGPLMVAIIVIGRSGTAIAAEMASMKLSGEVDSLWASGMNPVQYLLIPRLLGGIVSIFTLIVFFGAVALLGGFFLAWLWLPLSWRAFLDSLGKVIGSRELAITLVKSMLFGTFIPLICAYCGLRVQASPTEIPQAVTKAAVYSLVVVLVGGAVVSVMLYG